MKQKIIAMFLVMATLLLTMSGCGGNDEPPVITDPLDSGEGVITEPLAENDSLPTDPVDSLPEKIVGAKVMYTVNSRAAGSIMGETYQNAENGTTTVRAKANLGYRFVMWSDGLTLPYRDGDTVSEPTLITAIFDYDKKELPVLAIDTFNQTAITSKDRYVATTVSLKGGGTFNFTDESAKIQGRGNSTWNFEKKSYKIKLSSRRNVLGIGEGENKDWLLLANHSDQALLRNYVALKLYSAFNRVTWEPAATSVDLYLNGEYMGVYLLAEAIETGATRVDLTTANVQTEVDTGYLFKVDFYCEKADFTIDGKKYAIKSDLADDPALAEAQRAYIGDYINRCWWAVRNGDRTQIEALIDIDSLVDAYLFEEYVKNLDMGFDSFYMAKDAGGKMTFGPCWDFDISFGAGDETCQYVENIYCGIWYSDLLSNSWFARMNRYEWFRALCIERWNEVYPLIDEEIPRLTIDTGKAGAEAFARNFERWPIFGQRINRETEFIRALKSHEEHYTYMADWASRRGKWLNNYYNSNDYRKGVFHSEATDIPEVKMGNETAQSLYGRELLNYYIDPDSRSSNTPGFDGQGSANLLDGRAYTKYCLEVKSGKLTLSFKLKQLCTLTAFNLLTADDTATYPSRNPMKIKLYGSSTGGVTWKELGSFVTGMKAENHTAYGYLLAQAMRVDAVRIEIEHDGILQMADLLLFGEMLPANAGAS